jgi:hypothetical protein
MMTGLGVFHVCLFENVMRTVTTCHYYQGVFEVLETWRDVQMKTEYIVPSPVLSLFFFILLLITLTNNFVRKPNTRGNCSMVFCLPSLFSKPF